MSISLPNIPVAVIDGEQLSVVFPDGDIQTHGKATAGSVLLNPVILCNAPLVAERFDIDHFQSFDALELFAFVHPGQFCVPTPIGIAKALQQDIPHSATQQALSVIQAVEKLLNELQSITDDKTRYQIASIAEAMACAAPVWSWAPFVLDALDMPLRTPLAPFKREALSVWKNLVEWEEKAPRGPSGQAPLSMDETRHQLAELVETVIGRDGTRKAEPRQEQVDYAGSLSAAFQTPKAQPQWVMAEAGTGVGKTLGYLAPSLAWACKNDGQVWISTFTRYLQNQLQHDLDRIFPHSDKPQAVVRKGRENYLCILNLEEAVDQIITGDYRTRVGLGLMLRWVMATRDGDLTGGDLPGWLSTLVGRKPTLNLSDHRGECIHQACPHYYRCFIKRGIHDSRDATIVVANHALTLTQPFGEEVEDENKNLPTRIVFDEGHHLFDATDSAFAIRFSGAETAELKRWLVGDHSLKRFRRRGLAKRLITIVGESHPLLEYIQIIQDAAAFLPEPGWMDRIHKDNPKSLMEEFLLEVRKQVLARAELADGPYDIETPVLPLQDGLAAKAMLLAAEITTLLKRIKELFDGLIRIQEDVNTEDAQFNRSIQTFIKGVTQRCVEPLMAYYDLVSRIAEPTPENCVDWFGISRIEGRDVDIGLWRHYIDPMKNLVDALNKEAHSVVVTSATLKPGQSGDEKDWAQAEQRLGAQYLREQNNPALRVQIPSPFNYAEQTRVFLINDIDGRDTRDVADAYATLFRASGGGALGLFTAIRRLQIAHPLIKRGLAVDRIPLYAQHMDGLNTNTLVDIFRAEEDACLLGTDALRDGVDVPGRALRLVIYDRIPWPRPSILHKARREFFGKRDYDMYLTSMRLRQSFGRLIRTSTDHGVFVLLESALPSALYKAFPPGVTLEKTSLSDAAAQIQAFLNPQTPAIMQAS